MRAIRLNALRLLVHGRYPFRKAKLWKGVIRKRLILGNQQVLLVEYMLRKEYKRGFHLGVVVGKV
jgi:hypothetical protein